ncbi:DUF6600 domain-containing protein [Paraburkholderia acidisoli]|uniref:FecR protein n=1 Tax=Paraburkholderia acidisoli TaxID=2571748 RepID=A0A7Z2GHK5_9BURK|nr:DUF6600 domain-containing protein [Paraburkholderia acidisoli]QGZ61951.1 FecR protein [Paraburkholderia acidisoli]
MSRRPISRRPAASLTLLACAALAALNLAAAPVAFAQTAEAPPAPVAAPQAQNAAGDPPGRIARLDYMAGAVTTEPAGASDWSYAQLNRPLTTGDQLWNDANARSELHIGSTAVRMGPQTSLDVLDLDDQSTQLKVAQGTLSTRVREIPAGTSYEIDTPNLALGVTSPGDYRVDVAPDGSATTVTVRSGNVTVYGENGQVPMTAGQQIRFAGTGLQQTASNAAPPADAFDQWALSRDAAEDRSVSARYVSRDMPGYQDLDANGTWRNDPQYGAVWIPNAEPAGWAPYHDGHWVWQAPWGWTWVDDAPWGFAPYHYGRWAHVDDSWAWVPGPLVESAPPVYAPALVAFVGGGGGGADWGVNLAVGGVAAAGVAWFALGPGEAWHPRWADWSPHYYDRVNRPVVINNYRQNVNINVHNTFVNYRVPGAVTAVPATAFVHGQSASRFAQHVDPQQWRNARPESGTPGIAPVKGSFGPNQRRADYRPPAALNQRQVVATRAPVAPPAFHDSLAQRYAHAGGTVPGAGAPVIRTAAPAHASFSPFSPANRGGWSAQNVRVVGPHTPVMSAAGRPGEAQAGRPGAPGNGPNGGAPAMNAMQRGAEHGQPGAPAAVQAGAQAGAQAGEHGVPRPPQFAGRPEGGMPANPHAGQPGAQPAPGAPNALNAARAAEGAQHQPVWTQQHTPMAMRGQPGGNEAGHPAGQQAAHAPAMAMQQPHGAENVAGREANAPHVPQPGAEQHAPQMAQQPQARPEAHPQAPAQPRAEVHPQAQAQPQPQQQPRAEFHPQPQQQPRAESRPQPQQPPRAEFHPQPQAQARPEFHPQPQPQQHAEAPRPQPQPHPQPQPQPHPQERAAGGGNHDEHHHG